MASLSPTPIRTSPLGEYGTPSKPTETEASSTATSLTANPLILGTQRAPVFPPSSRGSASI